MTNMIIVNLYKMKTTRNKLITSIYKIKISQPDEIIDDD